MTLGSVLAKTTTEQLAGSPLTLFHLSHTLEKDSTIPERTCTTHLKMGNLFSSTSSSTSLNRRSTVCVDSHNSKHENADSFCFFTVEPSDTDSEEELGTAVEAYYQRPRRVGFEEADSDHMDIFGRSETCHETLALSLDHRMRTLFPQATNPGLTTPYGPWDSESSVEKLDDASSVYLDAEEFPRIDASPSDVVGCDTQLDACASRQLKDEPV